MWLFFLKLFKSILLIFFNNYSSVTRLFLIKNWSSGFYVLKQFSDEVKKKKSKFSILICILRNDKTKIILVLHS